MQLFLYSANSLNEVEGQRQSLWVCEELRQSEILCKLWSVSVSFHSFADERDISPSHKFYDSIPDEEIPADEQVSKTVE